MLMLKFPDTTPYVLSRWRMCSVSMVSMVERGLGFDAHPGESAAKRTAA